MMKKVLIIGNGAREHAVASAFARSPQKPQLYCYMKAKNPGMAELSEEFALGKLEDFKTLGEFAEKVGPDFAFIGPEAPLGAGVVDFLSGMGIPSVGPIKELAKLETSKSWTRNLLRKHGIEGNPDFEVFSSMDGVKDFIEKLGDYVVKPDGLTGGKGVKVSGEHLHSVDEAVEYCREIIDSHGKVVVEEKLIGEEFSLQCFSDGKHIKATPPVQDHKRLLNGDYGPNCYSGDTEILTSDGWKTFNRLDERDEVASFEPRSSNILFEAPERIYWQKHKGKMIRFAHRGIDLLVTPNHRMLIQRRKNANSIIVTEAGNVTGENFIFQSGKWKGSDMEHFIIPEHNYKFNRLLKEVKIDFKAWIRFMGLYLSEGYVNISKSSGKRVYVCQMKKSKHFDDFKRILDALPFNFRYKDSNNKFRVDSVQLAKYLEKFGTSHKKYVPDYIKNATPELIREFLDAFFMGDGNLHGGRMRFSTSSKRMIDDLQELFIKTGHGGIITVDKRPVMVNPLNKKTYNSKPVYAIEMKERVKSSVRRNNINRVDYAGHVGCVTTPTGFVVVRRNNRVAVSGNTGGMGSYTSGNDTLPFMTKEDTGAATRIVQSTCDAIRKETGQEYKGVMYGGFIITKKGVKLIEFNARLGDPEAMNTLTLLKSDLVEICEAIINGTLDKIELEFDDRASVCKYIVPEGYPDDPVSGEKVDLSSVGSDALVYYASVDQKPDGLYMSTSRAIGFVGAAESIEGAEKIAEEAARSVKGRVFHRSDIGTKELIEKRIVHADKLRSG